MAKRHWGFVAALGLAASMVVPGTAAAEPAVCGTTAAQWVGSYTGLTHSEHNGEPYETPLRVEVSDDGALKVDTYVRDAYYKENADPVLDGGKLDWQAIRWYDVTASLYAYDTTDTTCDANGAVTGFGGTREYYAGPPWPGTWVPVGTFELTRTVG